jgi:hypothetical protein
MDPRAGLEAEAEGEEGSNHALSLIESSVRGHYILYLSYTSLHEDLRGAGALWSKMLYS